ncbi:UvrD-helicase domain-containing protein [uncultured Treponema sp.]|uniref:UvrD-helicase domain-containing protein n=1 Tax=uncultured Treponema sp. TaxID=162155 RepID=UPI00260031E5|nr:UvrD-helicase domain-containing protein [uncultured Treponema sp.]
MLVFVGSSVAFAIFSSLLILRIYRKKSARKNLQKISLFQNQVKVFSSELDFLLKQIVSKEQEDEFATKWQKLYSEIGRYRIPKKRNAAFSEISNFKETFRNLHKIVLKSNAEIKRKEKIKNLAQKISDFFDELYKITENYVAHSAELQFIKNWESLFLNANQEDVHNEDEEFSEVERFKTVFSSLNDYFENANQQFIQNESVKHDGLFSNVDGKNLDFQQRTAVITDEDRILVLAGAGSGKTLTIAAKVKYLCEVKNINPNEILLVSFTKKSAQEMTERIQNRLGINAQATTFHKLGLKIIKNASGRRPEVLDENVLSDFIHNFFDSELLNHPDLIKNLTEYFTYFLEIPENLEDCSSLGELYEEEKTSDLETLKSKYDREKYIRETGTEKSKALRTLNNELVKSIEETKIANFLFMHGIKYEYERLYPFESDDPKRKAYRPDFYLCDYGIYLEHFGISKDFTVPWLSPIEEKKYLDGILWKRDFHKENGTKLIETYSYYSSEGILLKKLEELLAENSVEFKSRDFTDVFNTVYASKSNKYFGEFIKLCCAFITLFKSDNYKTEEIENLRQKYLAEEKNEFLCQRTNLFLDIIKILLAEYQDYLCKNNAIDFSDMINNAAELVPAGCNILPYKYVIVDEYQDISKSRFNFLRAIAERTGAKFFCVGDDWQSIYRFAGSDISLFTDFEKYFGCTKILRIEKTYRNSQQLIDEASNFILKNPMQLKKNLRSDKNLDYPLVFWGFDDDPGKTLQQMINKIVQDFGINSSILLLGRTNYDLEIAKKTGLFKIHYQNRKEKLEYIPIPELQIDFMSVHKSKGLEADNVILLNFKNDKLGFPNQIADDNVLNLVLTNAEDFKFAEERRLFYVAVTRTRNRTFILTDNRNPSPFFKEFKASNSVCFISVRQSSNEGQEKCPLCKTGNLLKVEHNGKSFVGCSNFPRCKYTIHDATVLENPKKCPSCGGFLVKRKGKKNKHWFIGCTNYPYCEYTEKLSH